MDSRPRPRKDRSNRNLREDPWTLCYLWPNASVHA
jgi:hypothetical protein